MKQESSKRIEWIDFARGLLMILVIFGHTVEMGKQPDNVVRGLIYSFHMPCFFLLSGLVYRSRSSIKEEIKQSFNRLIIPAVIVFIVRSVYKFFEASNGLTISEYIADKAKALLWSSGVSFAVNGKPVSDISYLWFLVVLFEIRVIFGLVSKVKSNVVRYCIVGCITVAGVVVAHWCWLPFSFDIALAAFVFFFIGQHFAEKIKNCMQARFMLAALVVWIGTLGISYVVKGTTMELACRKYTLFPLGYVTAVAATVTFIYFCELFEKIKALHFLCTVGRYSLELLFIHCLDGMIAILWRRTEMGIINAVLRSVLDITILLIYVYAKKLITDRKHEER